MQSTAHVFPRDFEIELPDRPEPFTPVVMRRVRPGTKVPLFCENEWNLACLDDHLNKSPAKLTFNFGNAYHNQLAKELMWQRLNRPVRSLRRLGKMTLWDPETCERAMSSLRVFLGFLEKQQVSHLRDVDRELVDAYIVHVKAMAVETQHQATRLKIVEVLRESTNHLTGGGLAFDPFEVSTEAIVGHKRADENTTPRIPEPVLGATLAWALAYVELFAPDIIAADQTHRCLDQTETDLVGKEADKAFDDWSTQLALEGRGVPAWNPNRNKGKATVATTFIARRSGIKMAWLRSTGAGRLDDLVAQLGLDTAFLRDPDWRIGADGTPWREPMGIKDMEDECRRLTVACYIVTAYLSGMRDDEVQMLERGCLKVARDVDGVPTRYRLAGQERKGHEPEDVTWIVIEPVARAIGVLEEMTAPFFADTADRYLFVRLHTPSQSNSLIKEKMSFEIRDFARHCTEVLAPRLPNGRALVSLVAGGNSSKIRLKAIPPDPDDPEGSAWNFTTRQFRRTMAWHIAHRPMGVIAGMIQYKHASIQMFEGYAGSSKSGFKAECDEEIGNSKRKDVTDRVNAFITGVLPAGPMAAELTAMFAEIAKEAGETPLKVVDEKRTNKLVRNLAVRLYPGLYADCFYDSTRARCQTTIDPEARVAPIPALCDPDCPSACWTKDHLPAWKGLEAETMRFRSLNGVSPEQRDVYDQMLVRIRRRCAAIEGGSNGRKSPD